MTEASAPVAAAVEALGVAQEQITVQVSYEVINLLSAQLYSSPLKAIEELVVNTWDADATECRLAIPSPEALAAGDPNLFIAVFDNGHGMTVDELRDLWHVGVSHKRTDAWRERAKRSQIGKFGIGKLATHAICRRVTYLTRVPDGVRGISLDFAQFSAATNADGQVEPVYLQMLNFGDGAALGEDPKFRDVTKALQITPAELLADQSQTWTLVILEELKPKASEIRLGRLGWVLRTAMPLAADFQLFLNGIPIESAKWDYPWLVHFSVVELEPARLARLREAPNAEAWEIVGDALVSPTFPSGVRGRAGVAMRSLYAEASKSADLGRSHGFFIRVRGRLVNEADPLFGAKPRSFQTWNRFYAVVDADDLDLHVTAPRDDIEQSAAKEKLRLLLLEMFNQGRDAARAEIERRLEEEKRKREGQRNYVTPRLVERPVADALVIHREDWNEPADWEYMRADASEEQVQALVDDLYRDDAARRQYTYRYAGGGEANRFVEFVPGESVFYLNEDHELVAEFGDKAESRRLLEILATSEALLEVYLRELRVDAFVISQLLDKRDELLRSLATDELYSLTAIAQTLRRSKDDKDDLEVAIVAAIRALGFVTRQISGAGEPDGAARYAAFSPDVAFTLEAKSSSDIPTLSHLDFAGLRSHWEAHEAKGCMLVAPGFPGIDDPDSQVAQRARQQGVSCWTVEQLASLVEMAEARHIGADDIQRIVLTSHAPLDVQAAVAALLAEPPWIQRDLYRAIVEALAELEPVLPDSPRTVGMVSATIAPKPGFGQIPLEHIKTAVEQLGKASQGMLYLTDGDGAEGGTVHVRGALEELRRRVQQLTGEDDVPPRRRGVFRKRSADA